MRHPIPLAIACLVVIAGMLPAQERIPLPAPDPVPPGSVPPPADLPNTFSSDANPLLPLDLPPGPPPILVPDFVNDPGFWIGLDGLMWWTRNQPLGVPIVTTGPGSQGATAGSLGMPGTASLDGPLNFGPAGGARLFAGGWFNFDHTVGMDGSIFLLGRKSADFNVADRSGTGSLVINEPVAGAPFNTQVSAPGIETGGVAVTASSRLAGGDLNLLYNLVRRRGWTVNLLGGYRNVQLDESLGITANSNLFTTTTYTDNMGNVLATAPPGSAVTMTDSFAVRNQFNGGQLGARFQYMWRRWSIAGTAKLGIGDMHEVVTVQGNTTVLPINSPPVQLTGGNYATLQVGRYTANQFALAPEAQIKLGYQLTPHLRGQIGYDFLFLSRVARPGNQIDNTYDGLTHPLVPMTNSSFWAQGLTVSLQLNF